MRRSSNLCKFKCRTEVFWCDAPANTNSSWLTVNHLTVIRKFLHPACTNLVVTVQSTKKVEETSVQKKNIEV